MLVPTMGALHAGYIPPYGFVQSDRFAKWLDFGRVDKFVDKFDV